MSSNQGRDIEVVLDAVPLADIQAAAAVGWVEVRSHASNLEAAGCECVVLEVLAVLYERGYVLVKPDPNAFREAHPDTMIGRTPASERSKHADWVAEIIASTTKPDDGAPVH